MRRAAGALLALLLTASPLAGQDEGAISGTVLDAATGAPLIGATVHLQESGIGTVTDGEGRFFLGSLEGGTFTVRVAREGYGSLIQTLDVLPGERSMVQYRLAPITVVLEGLLVTGEEDRAQGHSEGVIEGRDEGTVVDLLRRRVPGLTVNRANTQVGAGVRIRLRGVSSMRPDDPAIYLDGTRIDDGKGGDAVRLLDQIRASAVERIRVLRGPAATALYPMAAAGVILIETRGGGGEGTP